MVLLVAVSCIHPRTSKSAQGLKRTIYEAHSRHGHELTVPPAEVTKVKAYLFGTCTC